jgi:hypothetical protein
MAAGGVVAFGVLLLVQGMWMLNHELTPERVAARLEEATYARVSVGKVERTGTWLRPRVSVTAVAMAPAAGAAPLLEVEELEMTVKLLPLLWRRIEVERLAVRAPQARARIGADGRNDFLEMFQGPPEAAQASGRAKKVRDRQVFVAALEEARIIDGSARVALEKSGLSIELVGFSGGLAAIEVDPANLAATNRAQLEVAGVVRLHELGRPFELGRIELSGPASVQLFDPQSGDLSPDVEGSLMVGRGSYVGSRLPLFAKSWGKLDAVRDLGVSIPLIPERLDLAEAPVAVRYRDGAWELLEPLAASMDGWQLMLNKGFVVDPTADRQAGAISVIPTDAWAREFVATVGGMLGKISTALGSNAEDELRRTWYQDGRMVIVLDVRGRLSNPSVDLRNPLPDTKKVLEDVGKGLLDRLLGN